MTKEYAGERRVSLANGAGKLESHRQKNEVDLILDWSLVGILPLEMGGWGISWGRE